MATAYGPGPQKITRSQFDELLDQYFQKTLGTIVNQLRKSVTISQQFEITLSKALRKRNWLAHHYFWERATTFTRKDGRESMIEELREISRFFEDVDSEFTTIVEEWGRKQGMTEEVIQRKLQKLMDSE